MMAATSSSVKEDSFSNGAASVPFDLSKTPNIEGFTPHKRQKKIRFSVLVLLGCLATAAALSYGLIAFKRGKTRQSQLLMRTRIAAQGFTVVAILVGVATAAFKSRQ
uniref:HIG1 hypoxia inducible domain family, member 2A n=1 Tax=Erpetoichthys calabaricus TaxID=27687 RepID=A0A8C4XFS8_ERPCA